MLDFFKRISVATLIFALSGIVYCCFSVWVNLYHNRVVTADINFLGRGFYKSEVLLYVGLMSFVFAALYYKYDFTWSAINIESTSIAHAYLSIPGKLVIIAADVMDYNNITVPQNSAGTSEKFLIGIMFAGVLCFVAAQVFAIRNLVKFSSWIIFKK